MNKYLCILGPMPHTIQDPIVGKVYTAISVDRETISVKEDYTHSCITDFRLNWFVPLKTGKLTKLHKIIYDLE
jgi:hypothetical protein